MTAGITIGTVVLVDGAERGRIRREPVGQATPAGHRWVRMDEDGHSFLIAEKRLTCTRDGV